MAHPGPGRRCRFVADAIGRHGAVALAWSCALILGTWTIVAPAAAEPIGPHWDASQILAQHPGSSEVLVASYERVQTGDDPARDHVIIGIADDYAYREESSQRMIIDAKLRRIILVDLASGDFRHESIYGLAWFVAYELRNRLTLNEVLRRSGASNEMPPFVGDRFWIESDLGSVAGDQPRPDINVVAYNGAIKFAYAGTEVGHVQYSDNALNLDQQRRLLNLLRLLTKLHPDILQQVVDAGKLPHTLGFRLPLGTDAGMVTYTLTSARTEMAAFPLPAGARKSFVGEHPFYSALPVMEAAVTGAREPGPPTPDVYFAQVMDAVSRKAWFEALMLQTELSLLIGDRSGGCSDDLKSAGRCVDLLDSMAELMGDERVRSYIEAQKIQKSEPARAVDIWSGIPVDDMPNPYLMGVFIGNVVSMHRDAFNTVSVDPYAMFTAALAANPYVSSFYKDLGDHFLRELQFDLAWICYDLGRALPNRPAHDMLDQVEQIESTLRRQVPQYF